MFSDLFEQECALCSSFRCPGSAQLCHQEICQHQMGLVSSTWSCVQGSLPTGQLLPGVGACVSSGILYGDLRLLTQHPVSQTCFSHLLLDSSVFGENSWAQKQHCKTIYTETKMVLAPSWKSCVWVFLAWLWDE